MNKVQINCPLPGGTPPIADECDTTKTVTWSSPGITNTNFFVLATDDTLVRFRFTPISNNGSNIVVKVIYGDNGVRVTKQTFNLGQLPAVVDKYHVLNLGPGFRNNQVVTFETTTTLGTTGSFTILFDCVVSIGWLDFCYIPGTQDPNDLCTRCPTIYRVYWDNQFDPVGFPQYEIFLDPELQTEAPTGFYRVYNNDIAPVIYYYNGFKLVKQTACTNFINCNESISVNHVKGDYKYSVPFKANFGSINSTQIGPVAISSNPKNLAYSIKDVIIWFPEPIHGKLTITINVSGGDYQDFGLIIYDANNPLTDKHILSFTYTGFPIYKYTGPYSIIRKLKDRNFSIDVIFNANNGGSQALVASIVVGQKKRYKSNNVIQTTLSASCLTEINKYIVGVHPYSSYDSYYSPKNTAELYSLKTIDSWQVSKTEILFNDPNFCFPALPWYYSYGTNVFKIGLPYVREFGTITSYQVKYSRIGKFLRWIAGKKELVRVLEIKTDAINWILENNGFVCENCVEPQMTWGYLSEKIPDTSLPLPPPKYFYFLGYGLLSDGDYGKRYSSNAFFSYYDYLEKDRVAIGGLQHSVLYSPTLVPIIGYDNNLVGPDWYYYPWYEIAFDVRLAAAGVFATYLWAALIQSAIVSIKAASIAATTGSALGGSLSFSGALAICPEPVICLVVIIAIIETILFIEALKIRTFDFPADCAKFVIGYSLSPYIETGDTIYHDYTFQNVYDYYYCDGAYFYTQTSGSVSAKEQATYYDAKTGQNVLVEPRPDVPSHITSPISLYFLCYTAGRPDGTSNPYANNSLSQTVNKTDLDGDLLQQNPITYTIPEGQFFSSISQADADEQANNFMSGMTASTFYQSLQQKPNVDIQTFTFTHELKNETYPSIFELAYDNSNLSGTTVGKKLYYDDDGYFSVLNGFYSILADDNTNYKFFYQTSAGTIIDKWVMSSSTATTVTSEQTSQTEILSQTNLDYTSSWYFTSQEQDNLYNFFSSDGLFTSADTWNSDSFYSASSLVRGFIDSPNTKENFYLYDSNFDLISFTGAPEAYYAEIPSVFNPEVFPFINNQTLILNIVQECSETAEFNGVRVTCYNEDGFESPAYGGVEFVLNLYVNQNIEGFNQVLTYDLKIENSEYEIFQTLDTSYIGQIFDGEISTIVSTNPIDKFLYSAGTFTSCNTPTPTPTSQTWTPTPDPTSTITPSITKSPTPTPSLALGECWNVSEIYGGDVYVSYIARDGSSQCITISNLNTVSICIKAGTSGAISGFDTPGCTGTGVSVNLANLSRSCTTDGDCSITPTPTLTPTYTPTLSPTVTPSNSPTPSTTPPLQTILLSAGQSSGCNACGVGSYTLTGYTNPADRTPSSGDTIFSTDDASSLFNGGAQWFKTSWASSFAQFSIRISSLGIVTDVVNCAACATNTPTPSVTPTYTPTYSQTPTNTPSNTETPTETPTMTPSPTTDTYFYYNTTTYNCGISGAGCSDPSTGTAVLRFSTSQISTWFSDGITAYSRTGDASGPAYDVNGDFLATGASCVAACIA